MDGRFQAANRAGHRFAYLWSKSSGIVQFLSNHAEPIAEEKVDTAYEEGDPRHGGETEGRPESDHKGPYANLGNGTDSALVGLGKEEVGQSAYDAEDNQEAVQTAPCADFPEVDEAGLELPDDFCLQREWYDESGPDPPDDGDGDTGEPGVPRGEPAEDQNAEEGGYYEKQEAAGAGDNVPVPFYEQGYNEIGNESLANEDDQPVSGGYPDNQVFRDPIEYVVFVEK